MSAGRINPKGQVDLGRSALTVKGDKNHNPFILICDIFYILASFLKNVQGLFL